ncbi:hypothetical protein E1264_00380 [Actinomadura sp. KC216]|uniref:prenyltransferase/squalene oxidase repeat-containing protein n=1 Tax=Actinomadura sp. KC216 TaxID=2530370 RepID=UPI001050337B|nr:prenyltransferase/squalene oxidase repeat-containing protein [Actinomadura sp. KC216]TDB91780.1 hypothetical protein E1264_00380 [Actinomadura sp. KC216]
MSVEDNAPQTGTTEADGGADLHAAARELVAGLLDEPWGQVSPSVYETGRLVTLAPWLRGHRRRLEHLVATQRPDGGWGGFGGYSIVPTLSAVEALLEALRRTPDGTAGTAAQLRPAERGLQQLARMLPCMDARAIPDTPANDLIIAALIRSINDRLGDVTGRAGTALSPLSFAGRLALPAGVDGARLEMVRAAVRNGTGLPLKVLHALEVVGTAARGHHAIKPEPTGTVGASAAATAAWLDETGRSGDAAARGRARRFLERVVDGHGGLAPCGIPITVFERSWVVSGLIRSGLAVRVPAQIVSELAAALGPGGAAAALGLPADADTTSVTLYTLALLGKPHAPDALWEFETETHFCTWPGEQGFSVTVNAHVLDAFGQYLRTASMGGTPPPHGVPANAGMARYREAVRKLTRLLSERQRYDGSWSDRWHASPYYSTMCCALALSQFGDDAGNRDVGTSVRWAHEWVLTTQRSDGSWGRWEGTAEETAYALQTLALTGPMAPEVEESFNRGCDFLHRTANGRDDCGISGPALWHDKDLYHPRAIVKGAVLSALHLADTARQAHGGAVRRSHM